MTSPAILLVSCRDRKGLVAAVAQTLSEQGANILHAEQHREELVGQFFQRVEFEIAEDALTSLSSAFEQTASQYDMTWSIHPASQPQRVAVFVTHAKHNLYDLLSRQRAGELTCEIPLIISNHDKLRPVAELFSIPYHCIPVTKETKRSAEESQIKLLRQHDIDLVVLANYKQILTAEFIAEYPYRIINIHPSFLPAFPGDRPYHKAYERGVKLIGATSHYVTAVLDDGPIIEQDVVRVTHRHSPETLTRLGRDLETRVLVHALEAHLEHRIMVLGTKTIVFG